MAAWNDISNLWWLKQEPVRGRFDRGLALGAQIAQNNKENKIREDMNNATVRLKEFEQETDRMRVQSVLDTKLADQLNKATRAKGLAEISSHLALVAKTGAWENPEAEAEFWNIAARYPQSIERNDIDAIYQNTFNEARRRKSMVERTKVVDAPASIDEFNFRETLREKYTSEQDPALKQERLNDLRAFEVKAGFTKGNPLTIESVDAGDGKIVKILRFGNGTGRVIPTPDETKVSAIDLARYRAETSAIMDRWENYDRAFLSADGKTLDPVKLDNALREAYERAQPKKKSDKEPEATKPAAPKAVDDSKDPLGLFK